MFPLERIADEPTRRSRTVKYLPKSWPLAVKSPGQSLDYRANSYHIHLNTLGFHGYNEEISQNCPRSLCPINTSFFGTLPPSCHSASSNPPSWQRHCSRNSRTPARISSNDSWSPRRLPPFGKKWQSASSSLRSIQHHLSSFYHTFNLLHGYLHGIFSLSFPYFFNLQTFRNWPRKLLFPLTNPTFNALVH